LKYRPFRPPTTQSKSDMYCAAWSHSDSPFSLHAIKSGNFPLFLAPLYFFWNTCPKVSFQSKSFPTAFGRPDCKIFVIDGNVVFLCFIIHEALPFLYYEDVLFVVEPPTNPFPFVGGFIYLQIFFKLSTLKMKPLDAIRVSFDVVLFSLCLLGWLSLTVLGYSFGGPSLNSFCTPQISYYWVVFIVDS